MREYESPSSCYTYDHCPQKYKFRYIDKLPDPSGPAAQLGIAFEDIVYPLWNERAYKEQEDMKMDGMLRCLFSDIKVQKLANHKSTQNKIDVPCGDSRLVGYLDMLHEDNSITDLKTSKNPWDTKKLSETQQHIAYPYGAMKMGLIPNVFPVIFRYLIVTTDSAAKIQIIELKITEEDFKEYERSFYERIKKIQLDIFPTKRNYECNWCPYKRLCPAWTVKPALFII